MKANGKKELRLLGIDALKGINLGSKILFGTALVLNIIDERYLLSGVCVAGLIMDKRNDRNLDDLEIKCRVLG